MPGKLLAVFLGGMMLFFIGGTMIGVTQLALRPAAGPAVALAPAAAPAAPAAAPAAPAAKPTAAPAAPGASAQATAQAAPAQAYVAAKPTAVAPNVARLPLPVMAGPINRTQPATVKIDLETKELTATMADGVTYTYWTFNGTVPGPMLRVRVGDTVEVVMRNAKDSSVAHSVDFHSATGPGGGAKATQTLPGGETTVTWKALNPGIYIYHCATPMVAHHIANGMYGLIVVEPEQGYAKVDHEFYVVQGDFYAQGPRGTQGHRGYAMDKMLDEKPDYVVFNGSVGALTGDNALKAKVGDTVRIFFGVGGPNVTSSFHVIGEIFDRVHAEGASEATTNVQTTMVPAGGATMVEFKVDVPGRYVLVDHSLGRLEKGGAAFLDVTGPENPDVFKAPPAAAGQSTGGH
jgi:nitrite reductase (NO-forming)